MTRSFDYYDVLYLILAVRWTLLLTSIAVIGAAIMGLAVVAVNLSGRIYLRLPTMISIRAVQGLPLLVVLFTLYFGLASIGFKINAWIAAAAGLSIYGGAFLGEIWTGAIRSVAKTQWEAAASIGLTRFEQFRYVIMPQSIRIATPPTVGFLVQLIKNTSLASTVGIVELTRSAQFVSASTYQPFMAFSCVAIIYFCLCFPLTMLSRFLEERLRIRY